MCGQASCYNGENVTELLDQEKSKEHNIPEAIDWRQCKDDKNLDNAVEFNCNESVEDPAVVDAVPMSGDVLK